MLNFVLRIASALSIPLLLFILPTQASAEWLREERTLMGTAVGVEIWSEDVEAGERAIGKVFDEVARLDVLMNPWNPQSGLSYINRNAASGPVAADPEIIAVVLRAQHYSELSEGAFDISFASVGQHFDYRQGRAPDQELLEKSLPAVDYRAIGVDAAKGTIVFNNAGLQIDLGGIAKGYAVDRGIEILLEEGIEAAVVSAGGDSRVLGNRGDRPRTIGIRHPRKPGEYAAKIPLQDTAISTSGDYERFFVEDGVRFHHILDPQTGQSASTVQSASVIAPLAIDSDALSTMVFVLGVERGLALVNRLPGVDAIVIDGSGKLHYSAELLLSTTP
ncbi:MAG: FAD:protein FMN transferase [Halioglobus sp.]